MTFLSFTWMQPTFGLYVNTQLCSVTVRHLVEGQSSYSLLHCTNNTLCMISGKSDTNAGTHPPYCGRRSLSHTVFWNNTDVWGESIPLSFHSLNHLSFSSPSIPPSLTVMTQRSGESLHPPGLTNTLTHTHTQPLTPFFPFTGSRFSFSVREIFLFSFLVPFTLLDPSLGCYVCLCMSVCAWMSVCVCMC